IAWCPPDFPFSSNRRHIAASHWVTKRANSSSDKQKSNGSGPVRPRSHLRFSLPAYQFWTPINPPAICRSASRHTLNHTAFGILVGSTPSKKREWHEIAY